MNYNERIKELLEYIYKFKVTDPDVSLMDIILDYCDRYNIDELEIGDAISTDEHFKQFIENDCLKHKIFKQEKVTEEVDGW